MRKVFLVLMALSLSGLMVACSEDDKTVRPATPTETELEISTTQIAVGYTCTPYNVMLEATGGTAPYTWTLAAGSSLPEGVTLSADGRIYGLIEIEGSWSFEIVCTDAADAPVSVEVELTLDVEVTPNPSIALFYDSDATICSSEVLAFAQDIDCHVFIMFEGGTPDCAYAAEFMISIEDEHGNVLEPGEAFMYRRLEFSPEVGLWLGSPFNGIAVTYNRPMHGAYNNGMVHILTFGLRLMEDVDNMAITIGASPNSQKDRPIIAACDAARTIVEVNGRASALNYVIE